MLSDKRILIFGGTGSLGKKLISRLVPTNDVAVYSRDEAKHWSMLNQWASNSRIEHLQFFVGDIRDKDRVREVIRQFEPSVIIIAAALKQVDTCELTPGEAIATNITGTQNVINVVNDLLGTNSARLETVLFVSTDKACSPVNVYGMCKSTSERIVTSQSRTGLKHVKYVCVRYGNVLESRGSIIPLFKYQAENNEMLTVTDPEMTRYVMTLDDSVSLIEHAITHSTSGDTLIPKLKAMRIGDIADIFAKIHNKKVKIVGIRPGEKKHEDLINESESVRTRDIGSHYVISPAFSTCTGKQFTYSSNQDVMTKDELEAHLTSLNIINRPSDSFEGKSIEEIRK